MSRKRAGSRAIAALSSLLKNLRDGGGCVEFLNECEGVCAVYACGCLCVREVRGCTPERAMFNRSAVSELEARYSFLSNCSYKIDVGSSEGRLGDGDTDRSWPVFADSCHVASRVG